ncbi:MAG: hypothetical protein GF346_08360 [Candidatus Eisenbacteria bacterium]|nr:hypothetical protein [Candidatus Latescibacterota bacterium]MBD3302446.1 hypothetical protein [Candidatus Eisenbacteria bacterium]
MTEIDRIRDQIARAFDGQAWHGPPLKRLLSEVSPGTASARPLGHRHTIWEILLHVTSNTELVVSRLEGEGRTLGPEEDWPPMPENTGDKEWKAAVSRLERVHKSLLDRIAKIDPKTLDAPVAPGFSSIYVTVHGLIQHNLYHAGQIALLREA